MRIEENRPLAPLTTLGIGGPARWFVEAHTETDIQEAATWARDKGVALFALGGGSNILVADTGFNGLVLQIALKGIQVRESGIYEVAAGQDWDQFVQRAVSDDCSGIECLAGIPGSVGGTPVQNVGAYGQEVASAIERVLAFDLRERAFVEFSADECGFRYRRSRFNTCDRGRFVITRVDYRLAVRGTPSMNYTDLKRAFPPDSNPTLKEVAEAVRRIRQSKGMLLIEGDADSRSAGSFFKNPIVAEVQAVHVASVAGSEPPQFPPGPDYPGMIKLSAAWLIEKSGFTKGYTLGRAGISTKHTLALVNRGGASAAEIIELASRIGGEVERRFSLRLEMEPVLLGFEPRF